MVLPVPSSWDVMLELLSLDVLFLSLRRSHEQQASFHDVFDVAIMDIPQSRSHIVTKDVRVTSEVVEFP